MTDKECSICKKRFNEWGNNAQPVNDGRCCDLCNDLVVIPARIELFRRYDEDHRGAESR